MKIEEITAKLEQGVQGVYTSEKWLEYLKTMSKFHRYSFGNCILIMMQFPTATQVAGYNAWRDKFKRQVKKGAKAIRILAPCPHKKKILDENGDEKELRWTTFRPVNVFDISQTDGEELPEICKRLAENVEGYDAVLESFKTVSPVPVEFGDLTGANGCYNHAEGKIIVQQGMSEAQTIKTIVHEIAHAILHNKENGEQKDADRGLKEMQAESVAYTVCQYMGIETGEYSFEYVATWAEGKDTKELSKNLDVIQKTARQIIDGIAA